MLTKSICIFGTILFLLTLNPGVGWAEESTEVLYGLQELEESGELPELPEALVEEQGKENPLGVGWQHTNPASGFSVKFPVGDDYYLQPFLSFSIDRQDGHTSGDIDYGLRGLYLLPNRRYIQPYAGVGWGRAENYDSNEKEYGYQVFVGAEYRKFILVPAVEVGLGGFSKADGSFHAGTTLNFSLFYYF